MAVAPIVIDLLLKGTPAIAQGMRNVADTVAKSQKQMTKDAEREAKQRQKLVDQEARDKVRVMVKMDGEVRRIQDQEARNRQRVLQGRAREEERGAREKVRLERQATAEVERIQERARRNASRAFQQEQRDQARAIAERVRREEAASRSIQAGRERMARAFAGAAARGVGAGLQRVGGYAAQTAGIASQLGGGFSLADTVMAEKNLRVAAARVSAGTVLSRAGTAEGNAANVGRAVSTDEVVKHARAVGLENNIDPRQIVAAIDEIKKLTGNVEMGMKVVPSVARLATATGGDVQEMSGLAANIMAANPTISQAQMESQLRLFTRQGVVGGVEVPDFAKYGSRLTAGASLFGGDINKNEATLGAAAQMARQYGGASSAAEATLASQRFATDVAKHSGKLKGMGIDVSDHQGNLRDAESIIIDMLRKTKGDVTKLGSVGLGERGVRVLTGASAIYKQAGGGTAGETAVRGEFGKYTTGVTEQEVEEARRRVLAEESADVAMMKLRQTVGEELLPEFLKLIPAIRDVTPAIVTILREGVPAFADLIKSVASFVAENKGLISDLAAHPIGTLIAFEMTKSFAEAALPSLLTRLFSAAFSGAQVPGGGTPAVPAAGGVLGPVALATGGALQVKNIGENYKDLNDANYDQGVMNTIGGGLSKIGRYGAYLTMPFAAYGMDKALEATGNDPRAQERKLLGAKDVVDANAVQKATTTAIANGVREGVRQGASNSGPAGPARTNSMLDR